MRQLCLAILTLFSHSLFAQSPLSAQLDSFFWQQSGNGPGIALSIEKNGKIIYRREAGLANLETRAPLDSNSNFRLASLTKQFTAMGILLLQQQQQLSFDDPIRRWLPELPAGIGGISLISRTWPTIPILSGIS